MADSLRVSARRLRGLLAAAGLGDPSTPAQVRADESGDVMVWAERSGYHIPVASCGDATEAWDHALLIATILNMLPAFLDAAEDRDRFRADIKDGDR